jgi:intein/homing endonuclease
MGRKLIVWTLKDIRECIEKMTSKEVKFDCIIFIEGRRGLGKCQVKGDKVLMADGSWKNIENIIIGDKVLSPQKDGSFAIANVINTHSRYEEEIYEIKEVSREKRLLYKCAWNHEIPILNGYAHRIKGNWKKRSPRQIILKSVNARELSKAHTKSSHYISFSTSMIDFNKSSPEIDAYSLGAWIGDGSFTDNLSITTKEKEIIEHIKNNYPLDFLKEYRKKDNLASMFRFSIIGKFAKQLIQLGLRYKKSGDKFIPKEALLSSPEYRLNLLAGLIDTDGYVMKNKDNHIEYTTKSNQLAEDIKNLVFSLGGYSNIKRITKKCQVKDFIGTYYNVKISFENPKIIPLRTFKKERLGEKFKHNPRHIGIESFQSSPENVYGFEIDSPSQWYITNNWMVTHNSTLAYKILSGLEIEVPFAPRRDLVYSREETLKHLATKINGAIFSDEMINVAYKRDFYVEDQKELLKAFDMYRDSRNVFIGCIPQFIDLDIKVQKVCKIRLSVVRRGVALIQMQNQSIYSQDPWDIKNNQKIESKWALRGTKNPRYAQLTTIRGILFFGDLTPHQREEYDAIKFEKRSHVFAKYQDESLMHDPEQLFLNNVLREIKAGSVTPSSFELLCKINAKSPETIRRKINDTLKDAGDEKRWKDYCLSDKSRARKDKMGFELPQAEQKEVKEIEMDCHDNVCEPKKKIIELSSLNSSHEQEDTLTPPIKPDNDSDVFGFKS